MQKRMIEMGIPGFLVMLARGGIPANIMAWKRGKQCGFAVNVKRNWIPVKAQCSKKASNSWPEEDVPKNSQEEMLKELVHLTRESTITLDLICHR